MTPTGLIEVWRGGVNAWECDEYGHYNIRFYFGRATEGLAALAAALGHPRAFTAQASATLHVTGQHVRFLDEARAGAPLYMTGGLTEMGEAQATVVQVLHHAGDHRPCAAVVSKVVHATPEGRVFPWPDRSRKAAEALRVEAPDYAVARGVAADETMDPLAAWDEGLTLIGRGPVLPRECDVFGAMTAEAAIGRVSDGVGLLQAPLRQAILAQQPELRLGSAAVEARMDPIARPRTGEQVDVRSRIVMARGKQVRLEHWLCDPVERRVWARAVVLSVHFDLERRRAVAAPAQALAAQDL